MKKRNFAILKVNKMLFMTNYRPGGIDILYN